MQLLKYRMSVTAVGLSIFAMTLATNISAMDILVSSRFSSNVLRYNGQNGDFLEVFAEGGGLINAIGMDYSPHDRHLYVASGDNPVVYKYHYVTGDFLQKFVYDDLDTNEDETGGLSRPRGMKFGPDGNLYVASGGGDQVLRYDGATGLFMDVFADDPNIDGPIGLLFDSQNDLLVASALTNMVLQFDGETGTFIKIVASGGSIANPTGLEFAPDGNLLIASGVTDRVLKWNAGTCESMGIFASGNGMDVPIGITLGSDNLLYVGSFETDSILRFNGDTGDFVDTFVSPGSGGLDGAHFVLFTGSAALITDVAVENGILQSGGLHNVLASDDSYMHVRSGFGETLIDLHNMELIVTAITTINSPNSIDIAIESHIDEPAGLAQIRLRNWNTRNYETVGSYSISNTDHVDTTRILDVANYVDESGNIAVSVKHLVFVPFLAFTFDSFIDEVEIIVD